MKKILKESECTSVIINLSEIALDYEDIDFNKLRDVLTLAGASVEPLLDSNKKVLMLVNGLEKSDVIKVLEDELNIVETASGDYVNCYSNVEECNEELTEDIDECDNCDFPAYEDVDECDECDSSNCDDNELHEITDDDDTDNESVELNELESTVKATCKGALLKAIQKGIIKIGEDIDDDIEDVLSLAFNTSDMSDDEYTEICNVALDVWDEMCNDETSFDNIDNNNDDFEDQGPRTLKIKKHQNVYEKKGKCCPGKTVNENLKAFDQKDQKRLSLSEEDVKKVLDDINRTTIGVEEARKAFKKLKAENNKLSKIAKDERENYSLADIKGVKKALNTIANVDKDNEKDIKKLQDELSDKVQECLKNNKTSLHEDICINGKSFADYTAKELKEIYDKQEASKEKLVEQLKNTLNESAVDPSLKEKINLKNQLLQFINEELTYRVVRERCLKGLNEDNDGEISDEELENLFGPGQGEESKNDNDSEKSEENKDTDENAEADENKESDENSDENAEDEEVELSRIEITVKDEKAANELKDACVEAGIPEDAIEIEGIKEDDENSDENSEENDEENDEESSEDKSSENESYNYENIKKLIFEGEATDTENSEENSDETADENSNEEDEDEDDTSIKVILTDTDYAEELQDVLNTRYGISKEEFEEKIGGEIVHEDDENSDEDNENSDEEASKDEDSKKDDENSDENSDDKEDTELDPSELFKGL